MNEKGKGKRKFKINKGNLKKGGMEERMELILKKVLRKKIVKR